MNFADIVTLNVDLDSISVRLDAGYVRNIDSPRRKRLRGRVLRCSEDSVAIRHTLRASHPAQPALKQG